MWFSSWKWHFWICHGSVTFYTFSWTEDQSPGWIWTSCAKAKATKEEEKKRQKRRCLEPRIEGIRWTPRISQGHLFLSGSASRVLVFTWAVISTRYCLKGPDPPSQTTPAQQQTKSPAEGTVEWETTRQSDSGKSESRFLWQSSSILQPLQQNRKNGTEDGQVREGPGKCQATAVLACPPVLPLAVPHRDYYAGSNGISFWHAVRVLTIHNPLR